MRSDHIVAAIPISGHSVKTNYTYSTMPARVNRQSINQSIFSFMTKYVQNIQFVQSTIYAKSILNMTDSSKIDLHL